MDVRQLRYFLAVVDHGGFHRAAEALYVAQPSLSQSIKLLERDLGSTLFHRVGRGVVLTEAGRALIGPAREVAHGMALARAAVESVDGLTTGWVEITASASQSVDPLTSVIARFTRSHPGVTIAIRAALSAEQVVESVRSGRTELGLLASAGPVSTGGVRLHPVARQRFVLVTPPDGPFPAGAVVPLDALAGLRLIAGQPGTGMRAVVDDLIRSGVDATIVVESEYREAILPLVLDGIGVAVFAEAWRELAERAGARVVELDPPRFLDVAYVSRNGPLTAAARAFLDCAVPDRGRSSQGRAGPGLIRIVDRSGRQPVLDAAGHPLL